VSISGREVQYRNFRRSAVPPTPPAAVVAMMAAGVNYELASSADGRFRACAAPGLRGAGMLVLANASAAAVPARAPVRHHVSGGKPSSTAWSAAVGGSSDPHNPEPEAAQRSQPRHSVQPRNFGQLSVYRFSLAFTSCSFGRPWPAKAPARCRMDRASRAPLPHHSQE
jgi:hypothetical protein